MSAQSSSQHDGYFAYTNETFEQSLKGKTIASYVLGEDRQRIIFRMTNGEVYCFEHSQSCCESVSLEEIIGDLDDLVDSPILDAREEFHEATKDNRPEWVEYPDHDGWTFYIISTIKGTVTFRWYGDSNGYYAIDASLYKWRDK